MKKKLLGLLLVFFAAITLVACGGGSDKKEVEAALDLAAGFPATVETVGVSRDQSFPTTLRDYPEVKITWSSDKPQYLANDGKVTRPEPGKDNELVTVKVTATKGKSSDSKTVKFLVLAQEEAKVLTLSNLYDDKTSKGENKWDYEHLGEFVELSNLTVAAKYRNENAFYLTDGERLLMVYEPELAKTVTVGEVYNIKGVFGHNFGSAQISNPKGDDRLVEIEKVENGTPKEMPLVAKTMDADFEDKNVYNGDNLFEPIAYTLTGKLLIDDSDDSSDYHLFLVNPTYKGAKIVEEVSGGKAVKFLAPTVNIYYQGLTEPLKPYNGREVTFTYFPVGLRSDRGQLNYGVFVNEQSLVVKDATEEELFDILVNVLTAKHDGREYGEVTEKIDFDEKVTIKGAEATVTWKSMDLDKIDATGNILARPEFGQDPFEVTLKATITQGDNTKELTFKVFIMAPVGVTTVADLLEKGHDAKATIKGFIQKFGDKNFILNDTTGGVVLRDNGDLLKQKELGKVYTVSGTLTVDERYGTQFAVTSVVDTTDEANITYTTVTDDSDFKDLAGLLLKTGEVEVVEVTPNTGSSGGAAYYNLKLKLGETTLKIGFDTRLESEFDAATVALLKGLVVGDKVELSGFTRSGSNFTFTTNLKITKK